MKNRLGLCFCWTRIAAKLLPLLLLLALPATVQAQYNYSTNSYNTNTITITGYTGSGGDVNIPGAINGLSVTCIGQNAFSSSASLTSVMIPNSVATIGSEAFYWCTSMTNVTIGSGVTNIGNLAFCFCPSLISVYFNGNVPSINSVVFEYDANATVYYLPWATGWVGTFGGCPTMTWNPYNCTTNNGKITITGYRGSGGALTIPSIINGLPVTCIGGGTFSNCATLTSITIPNSVTNIGGGAFSNCATLTSATIPASVTNVADYAFYGCPNLSGVYFQATPPTLGGVNVFSGDANATVYYFPGTTWSPTFGGLPTVLLPYTFTTTNGTINITYYTGSGGALTIPNIINGLPVTSIGSEAFLDCLGLTSVTIPNSVTNIGEYAFYWCTGLTNVTIGNSVINIGDSAFVYCPYLTSITIPNSVTNIGDFAFFQCDSLTNITIGSGVTSIGPDAFWDCQYLTSITIPSNVTSIGNCAFEYCISLASVYFTGNAPSLGGPNVFSNTDSVIVYYLAGTAGWGATFGGCPAAQWSPQGTGENIDTGDWPYKIQLTFSGYNGTETLTNFPALVILNTSLPGFSYSQFASTNGYDLRFSTADGATELNYEIERWATNGNSCVWVEVPRLSSGSYIWAYWGNPGATSAPAAYTTNGATWPAGVFAGVWHMGQTNALDSTANGNNGTAITMNGSVNNAGGIVAGGQTVAGGLITIPDSSSLDFVNPAATISGWVYFNTLPSGNGNEQAITRKGNQWALEAIVDNGPTLEMRNVLHTSGTNGWTAGNDDVFSPSLTAGKWYYFAFTYNGSHLCNFENGMLIGTHGVSGPINQAFSPLGLGASAGASGDAVGQASLTNAIIDEIRVEQVFRSTNWIRATYLTVASNISFTAYGNVQQTTGIPPLAWLQNYYPGITPADYTGTAISDNDQDGMTAWEEFLAGTDPTSSGSCLKVGIAMSNSLIVVTYPTASIATNLGYTATGRSYNLESATNLLNGTWLPVPGFTNILGNNTTVTYTNASPNGCIFYRVRATLQ